MDFYPLKKQEKERKKSLNALLDMSHRCQTNWLFSVLDIMEVMVTM